MSECLAKLFLEEMLECNDTTIQLSKYNMESICKEFEQLKSDFEQENQRLKRILKEVTVYAKNNSLFGELYDVDEILSLCNSTE